MPEADRAQQLLELIGQRIAGSGPLRFSEFMALALYHERFGFYSAGGQAGRRGDFVTSPEVGPLFGACVANYLDEAWHELDTPSEFAVVEVGAGPGTLARAVLAAAPECAAALRYIAVETSAAQRRLHPEAVESVPRAPEVAEGVVLANELLDNLPFDLIEHRDGTWHEVRVGLADGHLTEVLTEIPAQITRIPLLEQEFRGEVADGVRVPLVGEAQQWLRNVLKSLRRGRVLLVDYAAPLADMLENPADEWIRTYRDNQRGAHPLESPGSQDITTTIPIEQIVSVAAPTRVVSQAELLRSWGIDALVAEGRALWDQRKHIGDLAAVKARSRISEAEALLDPAGLGAFTAFEWRRADR